MVFEQSPRRDRASPRTTKKKMAGDGDDEGGGVVVVDGKAPANVLALLEEGDAEGKEAAEFVFGGEDFDKVR